MQQTTPFSIKSSALVALAAFSWGLSGGIGGILMADGWNPYIAAFYRGAIGLFFILGWMVFQPRITGMTDRRLWLWSIIAGLGVAGNFTFYLISIEQGSVAVAATLMYCAPIFVYLVSFLLSLEQPDPLKWIAIGVVIFGIVLLTGIYDVEASSITFLGISAGLLAGLSYAIFIFGFKFAAQHGSPQEVLVIALTVLCIILIWPADIGQTGAILSSTSAWPLFLALGVFGAGLSFIFYVYGLENTAPTIASILAMIEPVTASLFGVLILSESLAGFQLVGMGLILVTVTALSFYSNN